MPWVDATYTEPGKGPERNWYLGNNEGKIECLHNKGKENLTWKSWSHWLEEWKHKSLPRTVCSDLAFSSTSQRLSKKCEHGQNGKKKIVWTTILSFRRKKNNKKNQNLMLQWLKHSPTIGNYEIAQSRTENIWYLLSRITNQLCHDSVH